MNFLVGARGEAEDLLDPERRQVLDHLAVEKVNQQRAQVGERLVVLPLLSLIHI